MSVEHTIFRLSETKMSIRGFIKSSIDLIKRQRFYLIARAPLFRLTETSIANAPAIKLTPSVTWHIWVTVFLAAPLLPLFLHNHKKIGIYLLSIPLLIGVAGLSIAAFTYVKHIDLRKAHCLWHNSPIKKTITDITYISTSLLVTGMGSLFTYLDQDKQYCAVPNTPFFIIIFSAIIYCLYVSFLRPSVHLIVASQFIDNSSLNKVPSKSQRIIKGVIKQDFIPSNTWRCRDDIYQVFYRMGLLQQFFNILPGRIIRLKSTFFTILFGPSVFSLFALISLPYISRITTSDNLPLDLYPAIIIIWASWSITYYYFLGNRHLEPLYRQQFSDVTFQLHGSNTIIDSDLPYRGYIKHAVNHFSGKGLFVANTILIGIIPAYLTYVSVANN